MTDWQKDVMMEKRDALERGLRALSGEQKGIDPNIVQPPGRQLLPTRVNDLSGEGERQPTGDRL